MMAIFRAEYRAIFLLLPVALSLAACSVIPDRGPPARDDTSTAAAPTEPDVVHWLLVGEMAAKRGDATLAVSSYRRAAEQSDDPDVAKRATDLAVAAGDLETALETAERWSALSVDNSEALTALVRLNLGLGRRDQAAEHLRHLVATYADGPKAALLALPGLLSPYVNQDPATLSAMDLLREDYAAYAEYHYALARLAMIAGDMEAATSAADEVIRLAPDWYRGQVLEARILMERGETDAALKTMATVVAQRGDESGLRLEYARMLLQSGQFGAARVQFEAVLALTPNQPEALYTMALLSLDEGLYEDAFDYLTRVLRTGYRRFDAYYHLGVLERERGRLENALQWFAQVQRGDYVVSAQLQIADVLIQMDQMEDARRHLQELRDRNPSLQLPLYVGEGEQLIRYGQYDAAFELLTTALAQFPQERQLRYLRALAAEYVGRLALAEQDLRQLIAEDPNDANALNALGYMLTVHTERFDEAEALVMRALELDPENPAIIDSRGWLAYRRGDLSEAEHYLSQAYGLDSDPEIAAHFGEVLWMRGKKSEAREVWERARRDDPDHRVLLETMERFLGP
ncbi:MAG: tetratricopeptide repeat protein [Pseudomonadota bacterium]|nr:tetratricopeptide repeat protein [Pseudomonadota bacterium]